MQPTAEQLAIIDAARSTKRNLIVSALAGAAKTSTLVMIAKALPSEMLLCLSFNKKIALEMTERLPGNCTAQTLNSLGHRAWAGAIGKRLILDTKKTYGLLSAEVKKLPAAKQGQAYDTFADIMRSIDRGKAMGYIPSGRFPHLTPLMGDDDFFASLDDEPSALEEALIRNVTIESINQALAGKIDFADQLLLPTVFPCTFQQFPHVMIDEAQDLSLLNHVMLKKIAKQRLTAVGDECQSIYGFRGADQDSMAALEQAFDMQKLLLSISFRCPTSVVEAARWRAPHMQWPEWAKAGSVTTLASWGVGDLPPAAVILCRNNAPLFSCAIKLLKNGRYPQIVGNDVGKSLLKTMRKLSKDDMLPQDAVLVLIDEWEKAKLAKSRAKSSVADQAECLRIFARAGDTLGAAMAYAEHLFAASGPIQLMTIHKSKGLEFDDVFLLNQDLIKIDRDEQERNLRYVAQTRAKNSLTYINLEEFVE